MADIRKLVTIDTAGAVTPLADLEVAGTYQAVRDTFYVGVPDPQASMSQAPRPFAGSQAVFATHSNAEIGWTALVTGTTRDQCLVNAENMVAMMSGVPVRPGLHIEWRPDGATNSTFYEVRGPAKLKPQYRWAQFAGAGSMLIEISVPVAPLARGPRITQSVSAFSTPNVVQLPTSVGGSAPAAVDVTVSKPSGPYGPEFGLLAWWPRQATPPGGYTSLLGVIEAETGTSLTGWASTAGGRGGYSLVGTASGAGTASAKYAVASNGIAAGTASIDVEIWAGVYTPATVNPAMAVRFETAGGAGQPVYTREWGQGARPLTARTGTWWPTRLGTVSLPITDVDPKWTMTVTMSWQAGSAGQAGLDWLMLVPAASRACSPTGELIDSSYPKFMPTVTTAMSKTVRSDLSGLLTSGGVTAADSGLGGQALEFPTGPVDIGVLLAIGQPDGVGTINSPFDFYAGTTMTVGVTPRFYLVRGQ